MGGKSDGDVVPVVTVDTSDIVSRNFRDFMAAKMHDILDGFAITNALFALTESKLSEDLRRDGFVNAAESASRHGYRPDQVLGLLRFLVAQGLFKERGEFFPTPYGDAVLSPPSIGRLWL